MDRGTSLVKSSSTESYDNGKIEKMLTDEI